MLLALAACGQGETQRLANDAAIAIDAIPPGVVEVTAYSWRGDGLPDPTAVAIFTDPDGVTLWHGPVDAQGRAAYEVPAGSSVTVLQFRGDPMNFFQRYEVLSTIRDVVGGDQLRVGLSKSPAYRDPDAPLYKMYATVTPPVAEPEVVNGPYFFGACPEASGLEPTILWFRKTCVTPTFDLLTFGTDANGNGHYVLLMDTPTLADGTVEIPNTWQPMPRSAIALQNVPANLSRVAANAYVVLDGQPMQLDSGRVELPSPGSHPLSLLHVPTTSMISAFTVQGIQILSRQVVVTDTPSAITVDFDALPVPAPQQVQTTPNGVEWSAPSVGAPDARIVVWGNEWVDGNNVWHHLAWEVFERADAPTGLVLPPLPASLVDHDPTHADPNRQEVRLTLGAVSYFDYDNIANYAEAKRYGAELWQSEAMFTTTPHRSHQRVGEDSRP